MNFRIVVFNGVDGSGKTTISSRLLELLNEGGDESVRYWILVGERTVLRKILKIIYYGKYIESSDIQANNGFAPTSRTSKVFFYLVLIDYIVLLIRLLGKTNRKKEIKFILFDRYIFDVVWSLAQTVGFDNKRSEYYIRFIQRIFPKPKLIINVDVLPEIAYRRRKEDYLSINDVIIRRDKLSELNHFLVENGENFLKLDGSSSVDSNVRKILIALKGYYD